MGIKALKIKIYQPQAHYRMPFTYQRRHTYPIPPYSTVIGLLCNVLGIENLNGKGEPCRNQNCNCNYHKLKKIKISICGNFESKTTEYTWFRNLSAKSHNKRFGYEKNRYVSGHIEHIGGQMPVSIDILNDVKLWIYLAHDDENFLREIKNSIENPTKRIYPLHLGRAEDWIVMDFCNFIDLIQEKPAGNYEKFFWIPKEISDSKVLGLAYRIPTFYTLENGTRNFEYIDVYLNEGDFDGTIEVDFDEEEKLPVFFC